ncbi:ABC transporter ATP-binding protein [Candidatus Enterococcus ferrettii]|uniref:ABC transporter domain-containing protein n=1 Tax=Candidatus Enterococcus ferrettii TaxID=2815324 RepID=A0ABV0EPQ2_9ENTE|nr:ATP-binding cassette domain-containing protein [Enterococcus sp. 665A]MBO1338937.1 ATP-binding cassette domain-containing protein [Enterococcus sp. 665A]
MEALQIKQATKTIRNGINDKRQILRSVDLTIQPGEFVTVLGGNGAGKSTLFNSISGTMMLDSGTVSVMGNDLTKLSEEKRANYISRVFQDPKMGTAPRLTVAENLGLAEKRGQKRALRPRNLSQKRDSYHQLCSQVGNGLENHLDTPTGFLSGGQRQALSLLMATLTKPDLLLLDEHTAALDPKTAKQLMQVTDQKIKEEQLTCLMVTHKMEDALNYGNRVIVMQKGQIVKDLKGEEKAKLSLTDLFLFFEEEEAAEENS